jgi:hypothetical protein
MYLYGAECLTKIDITDRRHEQFFLNVPSLDFAEIQREIREGVFAISDLYSYHHNSYSRLTRIIRELQQGSESVWEAPRSESWWEVARQQVEARRHQRNHR